MATTHKVKVNYEFDVVIDGDDTTSQNFTVTHGIETEDVRVWVAAFNAIKELAETSYLKSRDLVEFYDTLKQEFNGDEEEGED